MKTHAVGLLVKDRLELTLKTLSSLYLTEQDKSIYDLYILSNGSTDATIKGIKDWIKSGYVPIKNFLILPEFKISEVWNLFLTMTRKYEWRTRLDNDIIFHGTPVLAKEPTIQAVSMDNVGGVNPGAIPSVSFVVGASKPTRQKSREQVHSQFLDTMADFSTKNNVDMLSLIPVDPGVPFMQCRQRYSKMSYNGVPYIVGGCQMISHKCVKELGLMRENLPRMEDVEYAQRAIKSGLNIGYHDSYWCYHAGATKHTELENEREKKIQYAMKMFDEKQEKEWSRWNGLIKKINKACSENTIINLVKEA